MRGFRIAVAGCGPAGLAAALLLHRAGHEAVLFERFEVPRPIGSGLMLQPTGMAVLSALDLAAPAVAQGAVIERLLGLRADGRTVLDARYAELGRAGAFGLGIHRASLFELLFAAVRDAGIEVRTGHDVTGSAIVPGGRCLSMSDGRTSEPFDLVVDCLGVRSPLAPPCGRWLEFGALWTSLDFPRGGGFDPALLEQRYRGASEMVGVLPTGCGAGSEAQASFFWSLRADRHEEWLRAGVPAWRDQVLRLWPACEGIMDRIADPAQMTFARYAHRTVAQPVRERLVHLGDAWHSASPQLGQGANMALLDAWGLAEGLRLGGSIAEGTAIAAGLRELHVKLYQHVTALFTPLYQSDGAWQPALRDRVLAPLSRIWPASRIQALLVSGLFGAPLGRLGLAEPDYAALRG